MNSQKLFVFFALATTACGSTSTPVDPLDGEYSLTYAESFGSCSDAVDGIVNVFDATLTGTADGGFTVDFDTGEAETAVFTCPPQADGTVCSGTYAFETFLSVGGEQADATLTWSTSISRLVVITPETFDVDLTTDITCEGADCDQSDISVPCDATQTYLAGLTG